MPTINVLSKNKKKKIHLTIIIFIAVIYYSILYGRDFVMQLAEKSALYFPNRGTCAAKSNF